MKLNAKFLPDVNHHWNFNILQHWLSLLPTLKVKITCWPIRNSLKDKNTLTKNKLKCVFMIIKHLLKSDVLIASILGHISQIYISAIFIDKILTSDKSNDISNILRIFLSSADIINGNYQPPLENVLFVVNNNQFSVYKSVLKGLLRARILP